MSDKPRCVQFVLVPTFVETDERGAIKRLYQTKDSVVVCESEFSKTLAEIASAISPTKEPTP